MPSNAQETLEENLPLSKTLIWPLIESFYGQGPSAFDQTPYYPTNNAFLAEAYADLIVAFLHDTRESRVPSEPVYVTEWAAGTGVLAHMIRVSLAERRQRFPWLAQVRLVYVLTDFTEAAAEQWLADDRLLPGFRDGSLDRAIYRPETGLPITLLERGTVLGAHPPRNPVIVVANYFFDSIRHDYFRVQKGRLHECRVMVMRDLGEPADVSTPVSLDQLRLKDRYVPVKGPYYGEGRLDSLLESYVGLGEELSFLFPVSGLRCLEQLHRWTQGSFLLLCADKGFHKLEAFEGARALPYTPHTGSFSYMVNFDALRRYFAGMGGASWASWENPSLNVFVASPLPAGSLLETDRVAHANLEATDLGVLGYHLAQALGPEPGADMAGPDRIRALLSCCRAARHDPWVFSRIGGALADSYHKDEYGLHSLLVATLEKVEARLCRCAVGSREAGSHLRRLWFLLEDHGRCIALNALLTAWHGEERDTHFYAAAIHERRGEWTAAIQGYEKALRHDPACEQARTGLQRSRAARGDKDALVF